jgi:hypothetical protein
MLVDQSVTKFLLKRPLVKLILFRIVIVSVFKITRNKFYIMWTWTYSLNRYGLLIPLLKFRLLLKRLERKGYIRSSSLRECLRSLWSLKSNVPQYLGRPYNFLSNIPILILKSTLQSIGKHSGQVKEDYLHQYFVNFQIQRLWIL